MLNTDQVTEPSERFARSKEVAKFPCAVQRCGAKNDMVMDVRLVRMRSDNVSMIAFQKTTRKLTADLVGLLRCHLTRNERLPKLICAEFCER